MTVKLRITAKRRNAAVTITSLTGKMNAGETTGPRDEEPPGEGAATTEMMDPRQNRKKKRKMNGIRPLRRPQRQSRM